jgi:hypothetical protein
VQFHALMGCALILSKEGMVSDLVGPGDDLWHPVGLHQVHNVSWRWFLSTYSDIKVVEFWFMTWLWCFRSRLLSLVHRICTLDRWLFRAWSLLFISRFILCNCCRPLIASAPLASIKWGRKKHALATKLKNGGEGRIMMWWWCGDGGLIADGRMRERERWCLYGEMGRKDVGIGWQNQEANDTLSANMSV